MKRHTNTRRTFIKHSTFAAFSIGMSRSLGHLNAQPIAENSCRIGIIGLDTSHSVEFTRMINGPAANAAFGKYKVVAAYPYGSTEIASSIAAIAPNIEKIKTYGVSIVDSIDKLLTVSDVILLETNDGRIHFQQALPVLKAGKTMFIDKPIAASLTDTIGIFNAAKKYNVPVFSSSALRYTESVQEVINGKIGRVNGADVFTPAPVEKTHPDLFWYGIHGVEMLVAILGPGIQSVCVVNTPDTTVVTGMWSDNRIGTLRGIEKGHYAFGGHAFGTNGILQLGDFKTYYPLLVKIIGFLDTGIPPVTAKETIAIIAFMEAAQKSKMQKGKEVSISEVMWPAIQSAAKLGYPH